MGIISNLRRLNESEQEDRLLKAFNKYLEKGSNFDPKSPGYIEGRISWGVEDGELVGYLIDDGEGTRVTPDWFDSDSVELNKLYKDLEQFLETPNAIKFTDEFMESMGYKRVRFEGSSKKYKGYYKKDDVIYKVDIDPTRGSIEVYKTNDGNVKSDNYELIDGIIVIRNDSVEFEHLGITLNRYMDFLYNIIKG